MAVNIVIFEIKKLYTLIHFYDIGWNKRSGKKKLKTMILVAVIDIKIVATTGADLNHFV